ncbi:hypothetical protein [uncultured Robinsoniella sp.]|uniref:hypothetical protein n=1 Tax=uncultured Robinsoniella sp. TaxID=904190 RepID=UPI002914CB29|nr:hypothetical protein [Clostridiales bacterium]
MYKDRRGIYYNNFIDRILGIASPSLNWRYGGTGAVRKRAIERSFKNAELVEKWKVRYMRRNGENIIFLGYHQKRDKKYAIYICKDRRYATESKIKI